MTQPPPNFRFAIRDLLWLTVVVAIVCGWLVDHSQQKAIAFHKGLRQQALAAERIKAAENNLGRERERNKKLQGVSEFWESLAKRLEAAQQVSRR
jgi:hypothetical protein